MLLKYNGRICGVVGRGTFVEVTIKFVRENDVALHYMFQVPYDEFYPENYILGREVEMTCSLDLNKPILNG